MIWHVTLVPQICKLRISTNHTTGNVDLHLKSTLFGFSLSKLGSACLSNLLHMRSWVVNTLSVRFSLCISWQLTNEANPDSLGVTASHFVRTVLCEFSVKKKLPKCTHCFFGYLDRKTIPNLFWFSEKCVPESYTCPYKIAASNIPVVVRMSDFTICISLFNEGDSANVELMFGYVVGSLVLITGILGTAVLVWRTKSSH